MRITHPHTHLGKKGTVLTTTDGMGLESTDVNVRRFVSRLILRRMLLAPSICIYRELERGSKMGKTKKGDCWGKNNRVVCLFVPAFAPDYFFLLETKRVNAEQLLAARFSVIADCPGRLFLFQTEWRAHDPLTIC